MHSIGEANQALADVVRDFPELNPHATALQASLVQVQQRAGVFADEELDELSGEALRSDTLFLATVSMVRSGAQCHGTIKEISIRRQSGERMYLVHYADGVVEHLTAGEARRHRTSPVVRDSALETLFQKFDKRLSSERHLSG